MRKFVDLTGQKFGRLSVISSAGKSANNSYLFECVCECGNKKIARASHLQRGEISSCGCLQRENREIPRPIHGMSGSPTYESWLAMKSRCLYEKHPHYGDYGGRGVTIYAPWLSFERFLTDAGERPSLDHTLDRFPNKEGNYEPGNVRWATRKEQSRNIRSNRLITHEGHTATVAEWSERTGLGGSTIRERLKRGWSVSRALEVRP